MLVKVLEEFNEVLVETVDETLRYLLGDRTVEIFYEYLGGKVYHVRYSARPRFFFDELRAVLEFEDSGMRFRRVSGIGMVSILERTIIEILRKKFGLEFNEKNPIIFSEWVEKIMDVFLKRSKLGSGLTETEVKTVYGKSQHLNSG